MAPINLFDLYAKISLDDSEYDQGVTKAADKGESLASKLKGGLASAGKVAAGGLGLVAGAATTVVGGLLALEASTSEYSIAQGKLNTAFEAAGYSAETASQAYNAFYGILGDTDTATEASQLLAKLAQSEEDVSTWTDIAAGVWGTFGDSLPIESLIEASNETAKVGTVTGTLADALNWAGISEDEFNLKLAECSSESERNQLIMDTLSGTYDEASDAFYRNNEALVESRMNQAQLDAALSNLGNTVGVIKNRLLSQFLPSITAVTGAFADMLSGTEGADKAFSDAVEDMIGGLTEQLPGFLDMGVQILTTLAGGIISAIPSVAAAIPEVLSSIGSAIATLAPQLLEMGVQLITMLASGFQTGFPNLVATIPLMLANMLNGITNSLPQVLQIGASILNSIVQGILQAFPALQAALPQLMAAIQMVFTQGLPQLLQIGVQILQNILLGITQALPTILNIGVTIINGIINGILQAIPVLLATLPQIINSITTFFVTALPQITTAGINILQNLINGIVQTIPQLVAALPQILQAFINFILQSLPQILQSGIQMLQSLVQGVLQAIPELIAAIPQVIAGFVETIVANLPQILQTGIQLLGQFIQGIIQTIPQLAAAVPQIINTIVNSIGSLMGSIVTIGGDIVRGIWDGISGAAGWLWDQISGWFSGIVSNIKGFFGIGSPSKLMRDEIGRWIPAGFGEGISRNMGAAVAAANAMGQAVYSASQDWVNKENDLMGSYAWDVSPRMGSYRTGALQEMRQQSQGTTINQYIQSVPLTPSELARQSVDAYRRLRWA